MDFLFHESTTGGHFFQSLQLKEVLSSCLSLVILNSVTPPACFMYVLNEFYNKLKYCSFKTYKYKSYSHCRTGSC